MLKINHSVHGVLLRAEEADESVIKQDDLIEYAPPIYLLDTFFEKMVNQWIILISDRGMKTSFVNLWPWFLRATEKDIELAGKT